MVLGRIFGSKMNLSSPVTSADHSKAMVLLLLIQCSLLPHLFLKGVYDWSLFCCALLSIVSSFAIISLGKRERWLLYLSYL